VCTTVVEQTAPAVPDQSGGVMPTGLGVQLSKPGLVTRFACAGLTEAISKEAAKAAAMATGRAWLGLEFLGSASE
jgi:hypothetical protein